MHFTLSLDKLDNWRQKIDQFLTLEKVGYVAVVLSILATSVALFNDKILAYGDAESHINIAKRVIDGITPGFAQLGGVWLPLPHILMLPLVKFDLLWRSGLAGSVVSGISYIVAGIYIFKLSKLVTNSKLIGWVAFLVFATNPNILYLQSTPMTELPLICFFVLSTYYFIKWMYRLNDYLSLILAAFFGFCATLSRYDGWFLVIIQAGLIGLRLWPIHKNWGRIQGLIVLFCTLAFVGIGIWLVWDWLILGDPFYFTNSAYSAKSQQQDWLARGQLPAYHDLPVAFLYYFADAMSNVGMLVFMMGVVGMIWYLMDWKKGLHWLIVLLLTVPFIFNVLTLFLGQSVIFLPHVTPAHFDWRLFNARYGVLMMPFTAFFVAWMWWKCMLPGRLLIVGLILLQFGLFGTGYSKVLAYEDGVQGLSSAKRPDAERWLAEHYDGGLVLLDDFSRATSIIRSGIPMQNIIYIGNKPYWEESMREPEKHATWIVAQKDDAVWSSLISDPIMEGRLYKHFEKTYTSPDILIFRRIE